MKKILFTLLCLLFVECRPSYTLEQLAEILIDGKVTEDVLIIVDNSKMNREKSSLPLYKIPYDDNLFRGCENISYRISVYSDQCISTNKYDTISPKNILIDRVSRSMCFKKGSYVQEAFKGEITTKKPKECTTLRVIGTSLLLIGSYFLFKKVGTPCKSVDGC